VIDAEMLAHCQAVLGVRRTAMPSPAVLLSISGEDFITVDRKFREPWTGQLPTRIMFVSNELPRFGDASGAVATRCLILETTKSWLGSEDKDLTARLVVELPGVLNWSLGGLRDLDELGRFAEPASSVDARTVLADLVSPTSAFVREKCQIGHLMEVSVDDLFRDWKMWAEDNGQGVGSKQMFGRNLRAVIPGLKVTRPRDAEADSQQRRVYRGVARKGSRADDV
jgi:putative DNA primase/helicase